MKKNFLIILVFSFFTTVVFAKDEKKSITLDQAIKLALENNVSIKREQISLGTAECASNHSWNSILFSHLISFRISSKFINKR